VTQDAIDKKRWIGMKMIRVFPRKTNATPTDDKVYFTGPPLWPLEDREVHVSTTFTWDRAKAESLARQWEEQGYDVKVGGPAYGDVGGEFVGGRYVGGGYTITSRGCNNKCWFCYVWKREGRLRELPIVDGYNILDSNLLGCSDDHIKSVFEMLGQQAEKPIFTGGLEAKLLKPWHVDLLKEYKTERMYFAYDTPDDYEPLVNATEMLFSGGFKPHDRKCCCYCLIGYPNDTMEQAEKRLRDVYKLGLTPFAMLYRDYKGEYAQDWRQTQRQWARPIIIYGRKDLK